ncbi:hypothetical protein TcasGA2_TC003983 [Tribolium castaneum]|uniref:Uncharacterized protein n=1 Tax=Tribolium castaneum TaxID=7070 RepID=D6WIE4_TRICA|nr:hypothetical protein TcasGA2_TC003983 [Tribolium castaneum]
MLKSHKPQGNPNALKNSTTDQTTFALYRTVLFRDRYVGHVNMAFDATDW